MKILELRNPVQNYPWGSHRAIPELLGVAPDGCPQAELWMGAHPSAPSEAHLDGVWRPLDALVRERPEALLGPGAGSAFPFLLKILAADAPLSIQAHPSASQARAGFAREEAEGIPRDAPHRCYRDPNPKPELLCALTRFEALLGFRTPDDIERRLAALPAPELPTADLRAFFAALLALEPGPRVAILERAVDAAARDEDDPVWRRIASLATAHPGDVGALAPLFLHEIALAPGEALFLGAGVPHAYLSGVGVELMANSDNVLRGGLTDKHIAPAELLRVLRFEARMPAPLRPRARAEGEWVYETPAEVFELSRLEPASGRALATGGGGVEILLCVEGEVALRSAESEVALRRGAAVLVPAAAGPVAIAGSGALYRARAPKGGA